MEQSKLSMQVITEERQLPNAQAVQWKIALRNLGIEIVIYPSLVVTYFYLAWLLLASPLNRLFHYTLPVNTVVLLLLILLQGALLEKLGSNLPVRLGLQRSRNGIPDRRRNGRSLLSYRNRTPGCSPGWVFRCGRRHYRQPIAVSKPRPFWRRAMAFSKSSLLDEKRRACIP